MSLRKIVISALCALCAVSVLAPSAFAHGGHGQRAGGQAGTCRYALCTVEGCTLAGRHYHNGTVYCGADHAAGYCAGNCPYTLPSSAWGSRGGCHGGRCCGR